MNYESILKELRPTPEEIDAVNETTEKIIDFINETCKEECIDAKANAVGSVAKNTWLRGKSDIDIFIRKVYFLKKRSEKIKKIKKRINLWTPLPYF